MTPSSSTPLWLDLRTECFYMGLADHISIIEAPQEFHDKIKEIAQGIMER